MTKEQLILFVFFYLMIKNQWKIITVLIFIYFYFSINEEIKTKTSEEVNIFSQKVSKDNYYYNKFINLEKLKEKYPIELIRYEQVKVINGMLNKIPLNDTIKSKWYNIKNDLLRNNS